MMLPGAPSGLVLRTVSGAYIDPLAPDPGQIHVEDIAHALSHQCRFGGHAPHFYSVAQHSVEVAHRVPVEWRLQALLHDASEAYLVDVPRPIKARLPGYLEAEDLLMRKIASRFNFAWPLAEAVRLADDAQLAWEWNAFFAEGSGGMVCWSPVEARRRFLDVFQTLAISH